MKKIALKTLVCIMAIFAFVFGVNLLSLPKTANAAYFTSITTQDDYFSIQMTINTRRSSSSAPQQDVRTVTTSAGESVSYNCFAWRDVERLTFNFAGVRVPTDCEISEYAFEVTYFQSEDLTTPIGGGKGPESEPLASNVIFQNRFEPFSYFYYIDSDAGVDSTNSHSGHDFGLYRFDFKYKYYNPDTMQHLSEAQWTEMKNPIYIAILPDDVNSIVYSKVSLSTTIIPGSELLNEFNFSLITSTDAFDYINPAYLEWEVTGKDTMNAQYCRDEKMKNDNLDLYAPYKVIIPVYNNYHGKTFLLQTNGIEGYWSVYCYLINPTTNSKILLVQEENLSTVKVAKPSYIWIVYIVIGLLLLIALVSVLIIILRNRTQEKVW